MNKEKCGKSAIGKWLIQLREGKKPDFRPTNHYLFEAVELRELLYTQPELESEFPGIFKNSSLPLVLDVGCYMGHTVIELAKHNPGINVLGLDVKYKRVVKSCLKIKREQLLNAKVAICDIRELVPILPEGSVYAMLIFFPDPWIKIRHHKFRFLNEKFFRELFSRLSGDGFIWIKTDRRDYYEAASNLAPQCDFTIVDCIPDKIEQRDYTTLFESIFLQKEIPIFQIICKKGAKKVRR